MAGFGRRPVGQAVAASAFVVLGPVAGSGPANWASAIAPLTAMRKPAVATSA